MRQKTIKRSVEIVGIGLHKGVPVKMRLEPMDADTGIIFFRQDEGVSIPLSPDVVTSTQLATTISKNETTISTIEHLLSAVYAYGIDNLRICVDNAEIPIMDGSSIGFCMLLEEAGVEVLDTPRKVIVIKKPIEAREDQKYARLTPAKTTAFKFKIDFRHPLIHVQDYAFTFSTDAYKEEIAKARTFGFLHEVQYLRSKGLALGGSLSNAVVLDDKKILNPEGLRYGNEFVRHKILDAIGDLALLGRPIIGEYEAFAGSHRLNHLLTRELLRSTECFELQTLDETTEENTAKSYAKTHG